MTEYLARGKISELWLICIGRYGAVAWVRNGLLSRKSRLGILERNSRFDWVRDSLDLTFEVMKLLFDDRDLVQGGSISV